MLLLRVSFHYLKEHFSIAGSDPRTNHLPFVGSYLQLILLIAGYVVLATRIGPAIMAKRRPYNLKTLIKLYNIGQILLNIYIFLGFTNYYVRHPNYNWLCMKSDKSDFKPETMNLLHVTYVCYMSKILDTIDTLFFVLRKKFNQVSFLHVYHHAAMIWAGFMYHNQFFGSIFSTIGYVNSFIHILMYTYYMVSAMDTKLNLTAWKPRMTQLQILQFFYFSIKFGAALTSEPCGVPTLWLSILFMQNMFMTVMFSNFYYKTYIVKQRKLNTVK